MKRRQIQIQTSETEKGRDTDEGEIQTSETEKGRDTDKGDRERQRYRQGRLRKGEIQTSDTEMRIIKTSNVKRHYETIHNGFE